MNISHLANALTGEICKVIYGKEHQVRLVVMALLAQGHVLLEDLPGVGKTTLLKALAAASGCASKRIQFVPDLLPADILGTNIFDAASGEFKRMPGPVFTNFLLADEVNRALPRTQSALLEAMEERQVSIDLETIPLPSPFVVMATQNPVESESTFALPVAQMDRFLIRLSMGYPSADEELEMLFGLDGDNPTANVSAVTTPEELIKAQQEIKKVHVSREVGAYIISLSDATRNNSSLRMGASPRASLALLRACRTWASMDGRDYVVPDDVKALAVTVLAHRLLLTNEARLSGKTAEGIVKGIAENIPVPPFANDQIYEDK